MSQVVNRYSKETIKARMLQNAATLWGVKNERALDPFVKMLIEAFSTEMFKVSNEVSNMQARLLEKVARLLTPSIYTIPQPAHAIVHAQPLEAANILNNEHEFSYSIQLAAKAKGQSAIQIDLKYTPVDAVKLLNTNITAMLAGNSCYLFDKKMNKTALKKWKQAPAKNGEMWLALDMSQLKQDMPHEIALYFSNPAFEHLDWLYTLLPYITIDLGNHPLTVEPDIRYHSQTEQQGYEGIFNEYNIQKRVTDNIKNIYRQQFITIKGFPEQTEEYLQTLPAFLQEHFDQGDTKKFFPGQYFWLKLKFPPQYTFEVLEQFTVCTNAFPVFNRKWKQLDYSLNLTGNNIPLSLEPGEHFLSVHNVQDNNGTSYTEIPYSASNNLQKGLYSVRKGGMERFDERNALDMVNYLLELIRDEVSAFGSMKTGNVVKPVNEMVAQMKKLEQVVASVSNTTRELSSYVITEPRNGVTQVNVSYWVTHCRLGNDLRASEELKADSATPLQNGKVLLLTNTRGGETPQQGTDTINAYRYALTSRDRLVTIQDIKNFCLYELRDDIKDITIKKGIAHSAKPKEGFVRTTDIFITLQNYEAYPEHYWKAKERELIQKIDARAVDGILRRVFFITDQPTSL
ncbi:hypothetical protein SAMN05421788_105183 [Filimonas lacunae]|uniref:Uncharacterized protein n=1 Tax=Filimonas lacunae TaxID=477680 RepID=A0A173MCS1_9BACT|nr:type VI secretion system baseplate subunit TssF [Filimonas lacunae]BAV05362.1 hypothetical protein FLA_1369 [Filimonas lacunae]SIT21733.1 hypothetical protein SAMN05421788_105183 [Filimonas lacunae]